MTTRKPLTEAEKQYIYRRKLAGDTLAEIAHVLHCSPHAVRKWWRYARDQCVPGRRGRPRAGILSTFPAPMRELAIELKQQHPHWGPAVVKLELKQQLRLREAELPSDSRLSTLFQAECPEAVQPRRQRAYPEKPPSAVAHPHQRWQIDAQEKVPVGTADVATVLNIRDPFAALIIASRAFVTTTKKGWRKLRLAEIQDTLRQAFSEWGKPAEIQTDREVVYVDPATADFPSTFTLWLVGLGITHIVSRLRRPTDNAQVERSHRTISEIAWKDQRPETIQRLQSVLDATRHRYNEEFPVHAANCGGRPPLAVYPWARHSDRPFHPALEWELFDLASVDAYLTNFVWNRTISAAGRVGIRGHYYYLGRDHPGTSVSVQFLPDSRCFAFRLHDGTLIAQLPAVGLKKEDLLGFMPADECYPVFFQLPLPLEGV